MKNSEIKIPRSMMRTVAGALIIGAVVIVPAVATTATAAIAATISEIITTTVSAKVVMVVDNGVATLSDGVSEGN